MATREFSPWEILVQMESDLRHAAHGDMTAVMFQPSVDMFETDNSLIVVAEVAGVHPDHLNITLSPDDRTLTIAGKRKERGVDRNARMRCYQLEIFYGEFARDISLPPDMAFDRDAISARWQDGVVEIILPKRAAHRPKERIIPISQS